jgi:hypothetical protein
MEFVKKATTKAIQVKDRIKKNRINRIAFGGRIGKGIIFILPALADPVYPVSFL